MILQTDLIPHEEFHKGIWLSNEQVPWYFFVKKERDFELPNNEEFYETLDENLHPIVKMLHENDIITTPSCAGHFEKKSYYSGVYDLLNDFKKSIKNEVILHNDENGKKYKYRNKNYELPWTRNEFLDRIIEYQKKGVLGIQDNEKKIFNNLRLNNFNKKHNNGVTLLLINSETHKDCHNNWKSIHRQLNSIV